MLKQLNFKPLGNGSFSMNKPSLMLTSSVMVAVLMELFVNGCTSQRPYEYKWPDYGDRVGLKSLRLVTWNLGYGGLGMESDFRSDGGKSLRPESKSEVIENNVAITNVLGSVDTDIYLFQEIAKASWMNYRVDLHKNVVESLSGYSGFYAADIKMKIPFLFNIDTGMGVFGRAGLIKRTQSIPLESEGLLGKKYQLLVSEIPISDSTNSWMVLNLHLAAFDKDAAVRHRQIDAVFEEAKALYTAGHYVIIGGDWNLRLVDSQFPDSTDSKYLFWIHDFPQEKLPEEWRICIDPKVPTVRTLHQPYVQGDNYVTIIDGFIVSPNARLEAIQTQDLGFSNTDHHPVQAMFRGD